jgi:hypothetical protein
MIVTVPDAIAVTRPVEDTVAKELLLEDQITDLPLSTLP